MVVCPLLLIEEFFSGVFIFFFLILENVFDLCKRNAFSAITFMFYHLYLIEKTLWITLD